MEILLVALTLGLAYANGGNDVSKGIATLVGSGVSSYRSAVVWGTAWTVAGSLTAAYATQGLVKTFSGSGLLRAPVSGSAFLTAVGIGATAWIAFATLAGLPVSTTHALTGALCGAGVAARGFAGVDWNLVATKAAIPLALSPLLAVALTLVLLPVIERACRRFERFCICVESVASHDRLGQLVVCGDGVAARAALPAIEIAVGSAGSECLPATPSTLARMNVLDSLHWLSAGATSFFRGLNDTPKILAVGWVAAAVWGLSSAGLYPIVALAMGLGSLVAGFRVTETLACKITPISPGDGLAANLVASVLVGLASSWALPVSTTQVSGGAILGIGVSRQIARGGAGVRWRTVGEILLAWLVTLPVAAFVGWLAYRWIG